MAVSLAGDRDALQLHDVLRQCACLVGEDVLHLAQLLNQVRGAHHCREVKLPIIHLRIALDVHRLCGIAELYSGVQGYGHHVGVQDEESDPIADWLRQDDPGASSTWVQVPIPSIGGAVDGKTCSADHSKDSLHHKDHHHGLVDDPLEVRDLQGSLPGIHDDPRVFAGVDHNADAPNRIPQHRATQQQLLGVQGLFSDVTHTQRSTEAVD
mmetsp:Transcript_52507/g.140567  ORF Transcript_52507/g.140567 Transcript_52507/m.140567 type:complete len:210 (-) Transcript_52507:731-1360(-)